MIPVCIPYIHSKWGEELKYALRSWDRYFNDDFHAYVFAEECPEWLDPKCFIRVADDPKKHSQANQGKKLRYCCGMFKEFIWTNDDILLIGDICLPFLKAAHYKAKSLGLNDKSPQQTEFFKMFNHVHQVFRETGKTYRVNGVPDVLYQAFLTNTTQKLRDIKTSSYNCETHTPYYYESEKLVRLSRIFDIFDQGLHLHRTAYLNVFTRFDAEMFNIKPHLILQYGNEKIDDDLEEKWDTAKFLNFSDNGLTDGLKQRIRETFPEPSRFEV